MFNREIFSNTGAIAIDVDTPRWSQNAKSKYYESKSMGAIIDSIFSVMFLYEAK